MKQKPDDLNLRAAFGPLPESCREALMKTARSVKEEPMKRASVKISLVAAAIIILGMAAAMAVSEALGWTDFFSRYYSSAALPEQAKEILDRTEEKTFTLGPLTFRVQQLMADGRIALSTTRVTAQDREKALICMDGAQADAIGANGDNGAQLAHQLGLPPELSWMEAAKKLSLPLYSARAILEPAEEYAGPSAMEDILYDESGALLCFSMTDLNRETVKDSLPAQIFLRVAAIDPETGEEKEALKERKPLTLPVSGTIDSADLKPAAPYEAMGLSLDAARAELTPAGLYLYADFTAKPGLTREAFHQQELAAVWYDEDGSKYPDGISLSYDFNTEDWPRIRYTGMIAADKIPQKLWFALLDDSADPLETKDRAELVR